MKRITFTFAVVVTSALLLAQTWPVLATRFNQYFYQSACNQPVTYAIGTVDPRFKISKEQFLQDSRQSAGIWNSAFGKDLIVYNPNAKLKINLIYDERQSTAQKERSLLNQVKELGGGLKQLDSSITQDKESLDPAITTYSQKSAEFSSRLSQFKSQVDYWNSRGGAPPEEYQKLVAERDSLKQAAAELNKLAEQINSQAKAYSDKVNQYNRRVGEFNQTAGQLNQANQNLRQIVNQKPEEGVYLPGQQIINVYYDLSREELVSTIAHEMGHAIGLDHNQNPRSVMYPLINPNQPRLSLSNDDLLALKDYCQKRDLFSYYLMKTPALIFELRQQLIGLFQRYLPQQPAI